MKSLFIFLFFAFSFASVHGQVAIDSKGNYYSQAKAKADPKPTGKTYTDAKGNVYPVYISINGKLFVIRTSKSGNKYNQYLKV